MSDEFVNGYVRSIMDFYGNDAVGLILFLNRQHLELSAETQAQAYVEIRQLLRTWVNEWCANTPYNTNDTPQC
jgi:hypothetical protein